MFALDFESNPLSVSVSKDIFHHCLCNNSTDVVNVRTERDKYGNYNENTFAIDIIGMSNFCKTVSTIFCRA